MDDELLAEFEQHILDKVPHVVDGAVVNATRLIDLSNDLIQCAKECYNIDLNNIEVYGKFESDLLAGSIKVRPAVHIIHDAIKSGKLERGQTIIEATSGNFGIALGKLTRLGIPVISLVSRKLQEGVFDELKEGDIKVIDLDMDICPAPGASGSSDDIQARAAAANIRSQLVSLGFDGKSFDDHIQEIHNLLKSQDIINLARYLAEIYGCFCPEQYDNQLNINVHQTVTGPEIDQQLANKDKSLGDYTIFCTFGTGGTSGGLSNYMYEKYQKRSVHVVFPIPGQDVAGIRTKAKATGLHLYTPEIYAQEYEIDFTKAKSLLRFFVKRGHDIGESTALALYTILENVKDQGGKFVVIAADGIAKYKKSLEEKAPIQISLTDATVANYDKIVWVHTQYTPRDAGIDVIARALGVDRSKITIPKAKTVDRLLQTRQVPDELVEDLKGNTLLVCMAGNTSLMTANVLASKGITTQSLNGGITNLPESQQKSPADLVQFARE